MAPIPLGGLATGLDTNALVEQLVALERRPLALLQTRKLRLQALSTAFQELNGRLAALGTRAAAVADPESFFARSVASSAETVATATAGAGSLRGTFSLTVTALARAAIATAAQTTDSLTDPVATGPGVFELRVGAGGPLVRVDLTASTTLADLVAAINAAEAGVRATAVNAGTEASPAWQLTLLGTRTGAAHDLTVVTDDTTLGVATTQAAADAAFTIAGLGSFSRPANSFADVLDGVTITLRAAGSTDLTLGYDAGATRSRVQALVDAYNDVVRAIDSQSLATTGADGTVTAGVFSGDLVPRQIRQALAGLIGRDRGGALGTLAELGITTAEDGTLELDGARFQTLLDQDPDGVRALLAGDAAADGIADLLAEAAGAATRAVTGTIAVRRDGIGATLRNLQKQIDDAERRLAASEQALRARFTALEQTVARLQASGDALLARLAQLQPVGLPRS